MSNWCLFLHRLGNFMAESGNGDRDRPSAVVTLPMLDYASLMIASGVIVSRFNDNIRRDADREKWREHIGSYVSFPRPLREQDGALTVRMNQGIIDSIGPHLGNEQLFVRWVDTETLVQRRIVESYLLPLIRLSGDGPELNRRRPGRTIFHNLEVLKSLLGESGAVGLAESLNREVLIIDTKKRVMEEVMSNVPIAKFGIADDSREVVFRDLIRLDVDGGQAISETSCCHVASEPEHGWPVTILAGSLRFIRHWHDCDSSVRIAIISPVETNYFEAVSFANDLYFQRSSGSDLRIPRDLLRLKPASIDLQLMYTR